MFKFRSYYANRHRFIINVIRMVNVSRMSYVKSDHSTEYGFSNICELRAYKIMYTNKSTFFY